MHLYFEHDLIFTTILEKYEVELAIIMSYNDYLLYTKIVENKLFKNIWKMAVYLRTKRPLNEKG